MSGYLVWFFCVYYIVSILKVSFPYSFEVFIDFVLMKNVKYVIITDYDVGLIHDFEIVKVR